jgi:holin-like protein
MGSFGIPYPVESILTRVRSLAIATVGLGVLAGLALAGDALAARGHLPLPGPLIGTVLLLGWLLVRPRDADNLAIADRLIALMPLLFVPLLVEAVTPLRALGPALLGAVVTAAVATLVSLITTVAAAKLVAWLSSRSR